MHPSVEDYQEIIVKLEEELVSEAKYTKAPEDVDSGPSGDE